MNPVVGNAAMLLAAMIWGFAFVAQKSAMAVLEPFSFTAIRFALGATLLLLVWQFFLRDHNANLHWKGLLFAGVLMGVALFGGAITQQIGIVTTTAAKAAFITGMYIVLVPLALRLGGKRLSLRAWGAIALAFWGLYWLSVPSGGLKGFSPGEMVVGDLWMLASAVLFTGHILVVGVVSKRYDPVALSIVQFYVCAALSAAGMLAWEAPSWQAVQAAWLELAYAGGLSVGVAYTLQVVGQKYVAAYVAALVLSLEAVFGVLGGVWLLGESLSTRMWLGCGLMFLGWLLVQSRSAQEHENHPSQEQVGGDK